MGMENIMTSIERYFCCINNFSKNNGNLLIRAGKYRCKIELRQVRLLLFKNLSVLSCFVVLFDLVWLLESAKD